MRRWSLVAWLAVGCGTQGAEGLDLPEDPAAAGVPVGVTTLAADGETVDVWYPAAEGTSGEDRIDLRDHVPAAFRERVGDDFPIPSWTQAAVRDAPARRLAGPVPLVIFSHGFGGFRGQSAALTAHLASRGYVVVAADHPGRMLADVVPCLLSPPAGTCDFGGFGGGGDDPALDDLRTVLGWLGDGLPEDLAALVDPAAPLGIFGHSAGGATTAALASEDERFAAALPLAGSGDFTRDVPSAVVGMSCDAIVPESALVGAGATATEGYLSLTGAGHLAPSDLCLPDLGGLADDLGERDDANALFLRGLRQLATDGCPGATPAVDGCTGFLDLATSDRILRHAVTVFFDAHLRGEGPGLDDRTFPELVRLAE